MRKTTLKSAWSLGALIVCTLLCSRAAAQGIITTVAGGGPTNISARSVSMEPYGVAVDSAGNVLVASEAGIFRVDPSGLLTSVGADCGNQRGRMVSDRR